MKKSENVAANELSRELDRQLQDDDKTPWSSVPLKKVKVKGPDNPLSNFFPSKLKAFNSTFDTLEHAYQYKKLFDHDLFEEAESIRHIESPYDVKTEARKHIGDSKTKIWEECSERTMCSLLAKKRDVCPEFSEALKNTKGKEILHNVASPVWGTGLDGSGENRFGKILMRLRDEWFQSTSEETGATAGQTGKGTKTKPEVIIIGNSLLGGIKPDKLSKDFNTSIRQAYTIAEAKQTVANLEANPSVIVFQLVTNDVKDREATSVTEDYMNLIATTKDRKPEAHVIISQAPYQDNASTQSVRTALVNASIQSAYHESDIICTDNRIISGFANDKVHLNHSGTSMLARNIKASVLHTLGITTSDHVRNNNEHPLPNTVASQQQPYFGCAQQKRPSSGEQKRAYSSVLSQPQQARTTFWDTQRKWAQHNSRLLHHQQRNNDHRRTQQTHRKSQHYRQQPYRGSHGKDVRRSRSPPASNTGKYQRPRIDSRSYRGSDEYNHPYQDQRYEYYDTESYDTEY